MADQDKKDKNMIKWGSLFSNPNRKKVKDIVEKRKKKDKKKKKREYNISKRMGM